MRSRATLRRKRRNKRDHFQRVAWISRAGNSRNRSGTQRLRASELQSSWVGMVPIVQIRARGGSPRDQLPPRLGANGRRASPMAGRAIGAAPGDGAPTVLIIRPMNPQKRRKIFERLRAANPRSEDRARAPDAVRAAGRRRAVGAGDRQGREQGDGEALSGREHAGGDRRRSASTGLIPYMQSIGLFRNKAKNVVALSRDPAARARRRGAARPRGAGNAARRGRKTANVVLNVAFGQPTIAVDTHIFRVANRTGLAPGKTPDEVERKLDEVRARRVQAARASLADPARALRLRRAHAASAPNA